MGSYLGGVDTRDSLLCDVFRYGPLHDRKPLSPGMREAPTLGTPVCAMCWDLFYDRKPSAQGRGTPCSAMWVDPFYDRKPLARRSARGGRGQKTVGLFARGITRLYTYLYRRRHKERVNAISQPNSSIRSRRVWDGIYGTIPAHHYQEEGSMKGSFWADFARHAA